MGAAANPQDRPRALRAAAAREARGMALFRQLVGAMRSHYREVESATGIAAAEIRILSAVAQHPDAGVDQLAAQLALHKSTVSNLVGKLAQRGLLTRERGEGDQRRVRLRASRQAKTLLRSAPAPARGLLQELLAGLSARELRAVEEALQILVNRLPRSARRYAGESIARLTDPHPRRRTARP